MGRRARRPAVDVRQTATDDDRRRQSAPEGEALRGVPVVSSPGREVGGYRRSGRRTRRDYGGLNARPRRTGPERLRGYRRGRWRRRRVPSVVGDAGAPPGRDIRPAESPSSSPLPRHGTLRRGTDDSSANRRQLPRSRISIGDRREWLSPMDSSAGRRTESASLMAVAGSAGWYHHLSPRVSGAADDRYQQSATKAGQYLDPRRSPHRQPRGVGVMLYQQAWGARRPGPGGRPHNDQPDDPAPLGRRAAR